jgi:hypothetical protein
MNTTAVNYRIIRAPLVFSELWDHLAQNPLLARHVQHVEIQRQMEGFNFNHLRPATVPPAFRPAARALAQTESSTYEGILKKSIPGVRQAEKTLIAAVKNMTGLKSFDWKFGIGNHLSSILVLMMASMMTFGQLCAPARPFSTCVSWMPVTMKFRMMVGAPPDSG